MHKANHLDILISNRYIFLFCLFYNTKAWTRVYKAKRNNILKATIFLAERRCNLEAPTRGCSSEPPLNVMVTRGELPHFCMSHVPHLWSGENKIFLWSCAEDIWENMCWKFLWHLWELCTYEPPPSYSTNSSHRGSWRTALKTLLTILADSHSCWRFWWGPVYQPPTNKVTSVVQAAFPK